MTCASSAGLRPTLTSTSMGVFAARRMSTPRGDRSSATRTLNAMAVLSSGHEPDAMRACGYQGGAWLSREWDVMVEGVEKKDTKRVAETIRFRTEDNEDAARI